jgi:K+-sensing histidine kinase KdpD
MHAHWEFVGTRSFVDRWVTPITASLLLLSATTVLLWILDVPLEHDHLIFIYFLPTALIAVRYGSLPAMWVVIASNFAAAYLFYQPRFSFKVDSPLDVLELVFFSMLALLASQVVSGFAGDSHVEKRRRDSPGSLLRRGLMLARTLWRRAGQKV